jgi:diaminohydroxyphosphoribosylaminopyrimidine deaminase/5-amino-6-(5-phosphoribosylamino)uracil reductase
MVGAVLVKKGLILSESYHRRAGEKHAERLALEKAGPSAHGSTLYLTLEPCCHYGKTPPCTDLIIQSGVSRVVSAVQDPFPEVSGKGFRILKKAGILVESGLLEVEARRLNEAFFTYHEKKRPFVMVKWAMSLDGRTSTDSGHSKWITGPKARALAHRLRSYHDAVCVGVNTIIMDNPLLTVRLPGYKGKQPACVILDESLRTPPEAALFRHSHKVYILSGPLKGTDLISRAKKLESKGAFLVQVNLHNRRIDIPSLIEILYRENIQSVFVEGGRMVAGSFFEAGMVDKMGVFIAPRIIGGKNPTSPVICPGIARMKEEPDLSSWLIKRLGPDLYLEGYLNPGLSTHTGGQ